MRKILDKHINHEDYIEEAALLKIKKENPNLFYEGEAFRVLMFPHAVDSSKIDISQDASFSKSLEGVQEYLWKQDLSHYKHLILYRVDLYGLDINRLNRNYPIKAGPNINNYIKISKELIIKYDAITLFIDR